MTLKRAVTTDSPALSRGVALNNFASSWRALFKAMLCLGPNSWWRTIVYSSPSRVTLVRVLEPNLDLRLRASSIPSGVESCNQNPAISFHVANMTSRPNRASSSSSAISTSLLKIGLWTQTNPNSLAFLSQPKYLPRIKLTSALTVVPSSAASFSRERTNESGSLIVLRRVLRSSLLAFDRRKASYRRSFLPYLGFVLWAGIHFQNLFGGRTPPGPFKTLHPFATWGAHLDRLSAFTNEIRTSGAVSLNLIRLENAMIVREASRTAN